MTSGFHGSAPSRLVAVLGPTNTGKTHLAVERMLGHASGMIGLPLRLLAREIYDRVVRVRGAAAVALITGEEKIVPPRAHYFVCTVEAMPLNRQVEFLAVDEIQLAADPERGHIFTHRLLHARGRYETMFLGAATMAPLVRRLLPDAEIVGRERFSALSHSGHKKVTRLPRRSAVVAFSAGEVYAIAELIRRQRGGAAVVMGSLSPRTRNAQVALYQSGEVDFLVATDAIGMGLNMDVDHVAFAGLGKFDGKRTRPLHAHEVGQIAGRAGRYRADGTFGVTASCPDMASDLVAAVESHRFEAVAAAQWRNPDLDFQSLAGLLRSLSEPPPSQGLRPCEPALDETVLRHLAADGAVASACERRGGLGRLWDACQTPDFRKTTQDDHLRLVRDLFDALTSGACKVGEDWMAGQFRPLDRTEGEIDALSTRLSGVRTLAYVANRPGWLADPGHWQGLTRDLEDRLSDTLHEKLMARFIDRRTSALIRSLGRREALLAGVSGDGEVTVEGHFVGRLRGLAFDPVKGAGALEQKALRAAAHRAVGPEVARRLGKLAADSDEAFAVAPDGAVLWRGEAAGVLTGNRPFSPTVRLYGELGPEPARARAARRLEAFVAAEATRRLPALRRLGDAVAGGTVRGLARGLAWRLSEAGGVLPRSQVAHEVGTLSRAERRTLASLGVRIGAYSLFLPSQVSAPARLFATAFARQGGWRPDWTAPQRLFDPPPSPRALGFAGMLAIGALAVAVETLERLDDLHRRSARREGGCILSDADRATLGWSAEEAGEILRGLGFIAVRGNAPGEPTQWRRRRLRPPAAAAPAPAGSPFAALSQLQVDPRRRHRSRRGKAVRG
ncbi:MAG TPA: helicase-related protein [Caulobacteraceae bacterium]